MSWDTKASARLAPAVALAMALGSAGPSLAQSATTNATPPDEDVASTPWEARREAARARAATNGAALSNGNGLMSGQSFDRGAPMIDKGSSVGSATGFGSGTETGVTGGPGPAQASGTAGARDNGTAAR